MAERGTHYVADQHTLRSTHAQASRNFGSYVSSDNLTDVRCDNLKRGLYVRRHRPPRTCPDDESHEKGGSDQPDGNSQASIDHDVASLHLGSLKSKRMRSFIAFVLDLNAASEDPIPTARTPVKIRIEVAVLAGFNQPLCLAQSCRIDEHNPLLFECWILPR